MDKKNFQVFDFNGNPIRVILIEGEPWFVVTDFFPMLNRADDEESGTRFLEEEDRKRTEIIDSVGERHGNTKVVSEHGLYELVLRNGHGSSFKFWVTHVLFPTLYRAKFSTCELQTEGNSELPEQNESDPYLNLFMRKVNNAVQREIYFFEELLEIGKKHGIDRNIINEILCLAMDAISDDIEFLREKKNAQLEKEVI